MAMPDSIPRGDETRRVKAEGFLAVMSKRERQQIRTNLWRAARAAQPPATSEQTQ
jgi:hypothetical protein